MTFKEHAQLDEGLINPFTFRLAMGVQKIISNSNKGYKYYNATKAKDVVNGVFKSTDDFTGPPTSLFINSLKNKPGPNTIIRGERLRNFFKTMNISEDIIGYIIAFLAGAATVILLILIFTAAKHIKNTISYVNTKYKGLKGKFKKEVDDKDIKIIGKTLKAA